MAKVVAMVLAGGRVDELGVLTYYRPKSTMPYGALYRIIDFPLSNLMVSGIEQVGILSQYRSSSLVEHIGTGASWDMVGRNRHITILPPFHGVNATDWYKGTADAVYQNLDFLDSLKPELVMILSGDHIYQMDYQNLIEFHQEAGADMTAAFVKVPLEGAGRFGLGVIDSGDPRGGKLIKYAEKPETPISNWASLTIYLFSWPVLEQVLKDNVANESHEFGRDILPYMLNSYNVYAFKFYGYWGYSRTVEEYWQANMDLLGTSPKLDISKWIVRTNLDHEAIRDRGPAVIGPEASVKDVRFYNGVTIEGEVENSILFPGVQVSAGAVVRDSILFFDTQIGPGARVEKSILDIGVSIGCEACIGKSGNDVCLVGTGTRIPQKITIEAGSSVAPDLREDVFSQSVYRAGSVIE